MGRFLAGKTKILSSVSGLLTGKDELGMKRMLGNDKMNTLSMGPDWGRYTAFNQDHN
jgi:hypothetical protein